MGVFLLGDGLSEGNLDSVKGGNLPMKHVLTIAGSDSGGGAGIQADLKVISALGAYGMSVITAVTAQNTVGVSAVQLLDDALVEAQLEAVFSDIRVDAVKIGMLGDTPIIHAVAKSLVKYQPPCVVIDPVMVAKSGDRLLEREAIRSLEETLFPHAALITPNIPEAEELLGSSIRSPEEMKQAAVLLSERYQTHVLVKGGHLAGDPVDILSSGKEFREKRISTLHTHGTGCSLSSAIATYLAQGVSLETAIAEAKKYISNAIRHAFPIGAGHSPIYHFYHWMKENRK
jgi:hydroxymethylpyrimidine/phosphomethylpyrimidine kinase